MAGKNPKPRTENRPDRPKREEVQPPLAAEAVPGDIEPLPTRFTVKQYLLMNILFDAFCLLQLGVAWYFIREVRGLFFFFGLLIVGFALVSVFDYVYDRTVAGAKDA